MSELPFTLSAEQVEALRRGTHDYGGGYRSNQWLFDAFHHGIDTAFNVLASMVREHESGQIDTQNAVVRRVGGFVVAPREDWRTEIAQELQAVLLEAASFLTLVYVHRIVPPNVDQQATELIDKIGAALVSAT